ncbi:bifunctional adenosylcobinamide kinase/adenosylcobinamide-phosphate guanylyltransferase [Roseovarius salinarum]|uniref:bifunctional adenosylcobinamide kinase/adenosylcobinamide-phosphate guanylyltransferase n=1 Tax=Roseovarius salinarum TaxID=1981892 RepID=UPI000C33DF3A|nr:bifunctional adenosylcobinamide kinase/adenosylcobinamide-phosphate guanylyltransferase [Roseovarius salinarum]
MLPDLTLVLGGAASGKSAFAERLVRDSGQRPLYLATAQAHDDEMRAKIARHRAARGPGWDTAEAPREPAEVLAGAAAGQAVLLDCATMWLSNTLLAGADVDAARTTLLHALAACAAPVVVVSNEVGLSGVPDNALARRFRDAQGRLNQALAEQADLAVLVVAGLPQVLKGHLP